MKKPKETLCWRCKHAVPSKDHSIGCDWSINFIPVEGWKAIHTSVKAGLGEKKREREIESYIIKKCPKFERG